MIVINGKNYKELRCYNCQNFVLYHNIAVGIAFIKCPRCGFDNEWSFKYLKTTENENTIDRGFKISNPEKQGEGVKKEDG